MARPKVFVTRKLAGDILHKLDPFSNVEVWQADSPPPYETLLQKMPDLDGLLTLLTDPIDARMLEAAGPSFKVLSQMAVGYDNIDLAAATRRGIPVGHTPGVLTEATADFAWALLMAVARRVAEADAQVRAGIWPPWGPDVLVGADINGATLGIVGLGRIGQAVARRARGFNMRILYADPRRQPDLEDELDLVQVSFEDLLERSDFITIHIYLSAETRHLFGPSAFARMQSNAILINTSRGPVIDSQALIEALEQKRIAGAGLDVYDPEPIPPQSPLLSMRNVVITPHIASASVTSRRQMARIAVENLIAGLAGERLPYCANPQVYR